MNEQRISALLLERYHLGEIAGKDRLLVEERLASDPALQERLAELDVSDKELRRLFPWERIRGRMSVPERNGGKDVRLAFRHLAGKRLFRRERRPLLLGIGAAVLFFCVLFPSRALFRGPAASVPYLQEGDRAKGAAGETELSVYLKRENGGEALEDRTSLRAGNTVQLAYTVPSGIDRYGVIFSIDGRSSVTMHYPYDTQQSSLLSAGREIFLDEAYTLDDAPDFEIFFMVVSEQPLDAERILAAAEELAHNPERNPESALDASAAVFKDYEIESLTIVKVKE
jgi:hypothetical protein